MAKQTDRRADGRTDCRVDRAGQCVYIEMFIAQMPFPVFIFGAVKYLIFVQMQKCNTAQLFSDKVPYRER